MSKDFYIPKELWLQVVSDAEANLEQLVANAGSDVNGDSLQSAKFKLERLKAEKRHAQDTPDDMIRLRRPE